ncbi:MAG: DsbA family protein [Nitrospinae bacterium]|nr:DsbA family protein [Nitrospinota bacterium]
MPRTYVFRDFPIASLHPQAAKAHEGAHCAGEQGKYWEMHARLFANQKAHSPQDLSHHAEALGLDMASFQQCLESGTHAAKIRKAIAEGQKAGVRCTPTFFLGLSQPNHSQLKARKVIRGAHPYALFQQAIEGLLSSPE